MNFFSRQPEVQIIVRQQHGRELLEVFRFMVFSAKEFSAP